VNFSLQCAIRRIIDYKNLWGYLRELYQMEAFSSTTNMDHIKKHYYESHVSINPKQIVPVGPHLNYHEPHGRDHL
jgi:putative glutathione S-transferase